MLIFFGSFMAASLKIQVGCRLAILPSTRIKNAFANISFLGLLLTLLMVNNMLERVVTIHCPRYTVFSLERSA